MTGLAVFDKDLTFSDVSAFVRVPAQNGPDFLDTVICRISCFVIVSNKYICFKTPLVVSEVPRSEGGVHDLQILSHYFPSQFSRSLPDCLPVDSYVCLSTHPEQVDGGCEPRAAAAGSTDLPQARVVPQHPNEARLFHPE